MATLAVRGVSKAYTGRNQRLPVLDGVSLTAGAAEFVAVIGPSGCGKSTFFEIVCGLQSPDAGAVEIDGEDVIGQTGRVAYMPQDDLLFPWRRLIDNLTLPLEVQGMGKGEARERVRPWLPLFGLDGFEAAYPSQLSGGMRQRAALLRTFMTDREIVALDEPFGALDAHTRRRMQGWLADVRDRLGRTILLITHDVEEALVLADRVIVLSPRPARVVWEASVDLPRPRDVLSPEFAALKGMLLERLDGGEGDVPGRINQRLERGERPATEAGKR